MNGLTSFLGACALVLVACGSSGGDQTGNDAGDASNPGPDASPEASPDAPVEACVPASYDATKRTLVMEIVLDGTASMSSSQKWTSVSSGLQTFVDDAKTAADPTFQAGLIVFSDSDDPTSGAGPYPTNVDVAPATVDTTQSQKLVTRLANGSPSGVSAIGPALTGAYTFVEGLAPGARKVVVLATDGAPEVDGATLLTAAGTALASSQGPVNTLSVAIGTGVDQSFMGDLAVAGGTRASTSCDPHATGTTNLCYVQLPDAPQMAGAFHDALTAATHLTDCEWVLGAPPNGFVAAVSWSSGGGNPQAVTPNATDGYTLDGTLITFHGQSCAAISASSNVAVKVSVTCGV